jgi:1-acyl-sn-glycerol-3-phosphate acyltransferase
VAALPELAKKVVARWSRAHWHGPAPEPRRIAHAPDAKERPSLLRAVSRLWHSVFITCLRVIVCLADELRTAGAYQGKTKALRQRCSRLTAAQGIEVTSYRAIFETGVLIVANEFSYVEIAVIGMSTPCSYHATSAISQWPSIGHGERKVATILFLERDTTESRRNAQPSVATLFSNGVAVEVMPEETASRGPDMPSFKSGVLEMAATSGFAVIPVAITYDDTDDAWIEDDTFLSHFLGAFSKKSIRVLVRCGEPLPGHDPDGLPHTLWN